MLERRYKIKTISDVSKSTSRLKVGQVHQVYTKIRNNTLDVRHAEVEARLLTGTYTLQSNRTKFYQFNVSPMCQLCKLNAETREHFLITWECLRKFRTLFFNKLKSVFDHSKKISSVPADSELCTQLLLYSTHPPIDQILQPNQ